MDVSTCRGRQRVSLFSSPSAPAASLLSPHLSIFDYRHPPCFLTNTPFSHSTLSSPKKTKQDLAEVFMSKKKQGLVQGHGSGYGGSGFKFDKAEDAKIKQARKSKAKVRLAVLWCGVLWYAVHD